MTEDSLENTFSCVPKVQGNLLPNLSGKRTEMQSGYYDTASGAVLLWGLLFLFVNSRKKDTHYADQTHRLYWIRFPV